MKIRFAVATAAAGLFSIALNVSAHHSFAAEFDGNKSVRLVGKLTKIEWTNPHAYFYLDVEGDGGKVSKWGCEAGAPKALSRRGFKKGDLKFTQDADGLKVQLPANKPCDLAYTLKVTGLKLK